MLEATMPMMDDAWTITKEQQDADATEIKAMRLIPDGTYEALLVETTLIPAEKLFDSERSVGAPFMETQWEIYGPERSYKMFGVRLCAKKWTNGFGKVDSSYYNCSTLTKIFNTTNVREALDQARVNRVVVRIGSSTKGKRPRNYMTIERVAS